MSKRILLVEDNAPLRAVVALTLERAGYQVAAVGTVRDALAHGGGWDGLILDRVLPNGDGLLVAARFPGVPALTTSGCGDCDLPKPFTARQLLAALDAKLGGAS